jgi:class 3 adenylate cyclase
VSQGRIAYTQVGGGEVAYSVIELGTPSIDLLHIPGLVNHIEAAADEPAVALHHSQLAAFSRLVIYDRRGSGLSSPLPLDRPPTMEERADEALGVMDAVGLSRAAIYATADAAPVALFLAAAHPERITSLVLYDGTARYTATDDYAEGIDHEVLVELLDKEFARWGDDQHPCGLEMMVPSRQDDAAVARSIGRMQRMAGTPMAAKRFWELFMLMDARSTLPAIQVPTLVLHRRGDLLIPFDQGRYVASHVPGAEFIELPGTDHFFFWDHADDIAREVGRFLIGSTPSAQANRVLATVMFTDIVSSTELASTVGDRTWRSLLEQHNRLVREDLHRYQGKEIDTTGDGFLATFDAPGRAIACARAISERVRTLGIEVRAGLHTGEVESIGEAIGGIAVHIGARVGALAGAGEVLVSRTVVDLVAGSGIEFIERGEHELKGVPGSWKLFAVSD